MFRFVLIFAAFMSSLLTAAPISVPPTPDYNLVRGDSARREFFKLQNKEGSYIVDFRSSTHYYWDVDTNFVVLEQVRLNERVCHFGFEAFYANRDDVRLLTVYMCFNEGLKLPAPTISGAECTRVEGRTQCNPGPLPSIGVGNLLVGAASEADFQNLRAKPYIDYLNLSIEVDFVMGGSAGSSAIY